MKFPERKLSNGALIKYSGYHDHVLDEPHFYYGNDHLMNRVPRGTFRALPEPIRSEALAAIAWIMHEVNQDRQSAQAFMDRYER